MKNKSYFDRHLGQFLIAPGTLVIFGVMLTPIFYAFYISLNKLTFRGENTLYDFVGFGNYVDIVAKDPWFSKSILTTLEFTLLTVAAEIVLGIGIALVLNKEFFGRGFVRGLMILPWAMPTVVNAVMWKWILNPNYGAANGILLKLGLIENKVYWLATPRGAFLSILVANVWKETPYVVLLTIAALSTIPEDLYEAGSIDGAGGWKAFWKITLPLIKQVVLILTITKTIWAFQTFDLVVVMTSGGPENSTNLLSYYIYRVAFKMNRFGSAAAMSYSLSMLCFLLTFIYIKVFMGSGDEPKQDKLAKKQRRQLR
ncbi:MAG: sugar ABC transporter permease [Clostridiales bacterium]|nr:sugar ABC transporter permease [Clostridiales bacterium]